MISLFVACHNGPHFLSARSNLHRLSICTSLPEDISSMKFYETLIKAIASVEWRGCCLQTGRKLRKCGYIAEMGFLGQ